MKFINTAIILVSLSLVPNVSFSTETVDIPFGFYYSKYTQQEPGDDQVFEIERYFVYKNMAALRAYVKLAGPVSFSDWKKSDSTHLQEDQFYKLREGLTSKVLPVLGGKDQVGYVTFKLSVTL